MTGEETREEEIRDNEEDELYRDALRAYQAFQYRRGFIELALMYRIPRKVEKNYDGNGDAHCPCPSCGEELSVIGAKYCMECGQRLDWRQIHEV